MLSVTEHTPSRACEFLEWSLHLIKALCSEQDLLLNLPWDQLIELMGVPDNSGRQNFIKCRVRGFSGGSGVRNPPASADDTGSIPDPGRSHMPYPPQ